MYRLQQKIHDLFLHKAIYFFHLPTLRTKETSKSKKNITHSIFRHRLSQFIPNHVETLFKMKDATMTSFPHKIHD